MRQNYLDNDKASKDHASGQALGVPEGVAVPKNYSL